MPGRYRPPSDSSLFDDKEMVPAKITRGSLAMLRTLSGVYGGTIAEWTEKLLRPVLIKKMKEMAQELEERYLDEEEQQEQKKPTRKKS